MTKADKDWATGTDGQMIHIDRNNAAELAKHVDPTRLVSLLLWAMEREAALGKEIAELNQRLATIEGIAKGRSA